MPILDRKLKNLRSESDNKLPMTLKLKLRAAMRPIRYTETVDNIIRHERAKWIQKKTKSSINAVYTCLHCNRDYQKRHHLQRHLKTHDSKKKEYECDICGKLFTRCDTVQRHKREIHSERKHECSICLRNYPTLTQLNRHLKIHLRNKNKA